MDKKFFAEYVASVIFALLGFLMLGTGIFAYEMKDILGVVICYIFMLLCFILSVSIYKDIPSALRAHDKKAKGKN